MSTHTNGNGSGRKKPRITVAQAARAFRKARGDNPKVLLLDDDDHEIRRDENGYFVLCDRSETDRNSRRNRSFTYNTIR